MADLVKKRCRNVATHLQIGTPVSVAGDFFFADQPVIPRITGVVQEAINKAGKVKVKWDVDNTISSVDHFELMDFQVGQNSKENIESEHALVVEGDIPEDTSHRSFTKLKLKVEKTIRGLRQTVCDDDTEDSESGKEQESTNEEESEANDDSEEKDSDYVDSDDEKENIKKKKKKRTTIKSKGRKGKDQDQVDSEEEYESNLEESEDEKNSGSKGKQKKGKVNSKKLIVKLKSGKRKYTKGKKEKSVSEPKRKKVKRKKKVIRSAQAKAKDVEEEIEQENNILDANDEDDIVHVDITAKKDFGIVWKEGGWTEDPRRVDGACGNYGPRLNRLCPDVSNEESFFLQFLPQTFIKEELLPATNKFAYSNGVHLNLGYAEFIRFLGLIYSMEIYKLPSRDMYWWKEPRGIFPALNFGKVMARSRFNDIIAYLAYSADEDENLQIIDFVRAVNDCFARAFVPGDTMCLDESMVKSYHRDLQGKIKIKRKPRPIGNEIKDIADARSKLVYKLEVYEGKDIMAEKEFYQELGATTATTKRLVSGLENTKRVIIGDSWFGSLKTAVMLMEMGLYSIMLVKTAHKNFPMEELNGQTLKRGEWKSLHAEVFGDSGTKVKLLATDFLDLQLKHFISTCSTTNSAPPRITKHAGEIARPYVAFDYLQFSAAIDIFNHVRHGSVGLEDALMTKSATLRQFCGLTGFIFTNAFLAYSYFKDDTTTHHNFKLNLANHLVVFQEMKGPLQVRNVSNNYHQEQVQGEHCCRKLAPKGERKQLRCYCCSQWYKIVQLTSYYCTKCKKPMCPGTSTRRCFERHLREGLPEPNDRRRK